MYYKMITMVKSYDTNANMKSNFKINELLLQINRIPDIEIRDLLLFTFVNIV